MKLIFIKIYCRTQPFLLWALAQKPKNLYGNRTQIIKVVSNRNTILGSFPFDYEIEIERINIFLTSWT
jgi:hypothetical protein